MKRDSRRRTAWLLLFISLGLGVLAAGAVLAATAPGPQDEMHAGHIHHGQEARQLSFFENLWESYTPRRVCMFYQTPVIALHVLSDSAIALAYYSIPFALVYFVRRRRDLEFSWVFLLFALFILACGTTHLFGVIDIWRPFYKVDGIVKLVTAFASVGTAIAMWPLIPKALALPSASMLEHRVQERTEELHQANAALRDEIAARQRAEHEREQLLESERVARTEAEQANRIKDEFLATLSHELRTPLNGILGWTQLLRSAPIDNPEIAEGLDVIERSARAQTRIIQDLLDMSSVISGKVMLDLQSVDLHDVVKSAVDALQPAMEAKHIRLHQHLEPDTGPIRGDLARLQQIAWNLLSNAVKFTPKGGSVTIRAQRRDSNIELVVADTGEGIEPEFLPHVFDRFRQADSSSRRRHGGLGLGLAIVKQLVELHGGSVRAESAGPGSGSTFTVTLPLPAVRDQDLATVGEQKGNGWQPNLEGIRVLVVDDEPDARELVRRVLERAGASGASADSARAAMELLTHERFDVIVSDIGMPEEDGLHFLRRVRSLPPEKGGATPAVALTAYAAAQDRLRSLRAGYQIHLPKPVEADELLAAVANLVGRAGQDAQ